MPSAPVLRASTDFRSGGRITRAFAIFQVLHFLILCLIQPRLFLLAAMVIPVLVWACFSLWTSVRLGPGEIVITRPSCLGRRQWSFSWTRVRPILAWGIDPLAVLDGLRFDDDRRSPPHSLVVSANRTHECRHQVFVSVDQPLVRRLAAALAIDWRLRRADVARGAMIHSMSAKTPTNYLSEKIYDAYGAALFPIFSLAPAGIAWLAIILGSSSS